MVTEERLSLYQQLLLDAVRAALEASAAVLLLYQEGNFGVILKSDSTPLTSADKFAHTIIREQLARNRIPVFSEEGRQYDHQERKDWEMYWLVDPLDGTRGFIALTDDFTVNIALIVNDKPMLGVIDVPANHTLYFNIPGDGAYRIVESHRLLEGCDGNLTVELLREKGQRLPLEYAESRRQGFRVLCSRLHMAHEMESYFNVLREIYGDIQVDAMGSSLKFCHVAEGSADLYPRISKTMEWDTAAGQAIVEGAGMQVVDFRNFKPLTYNKESIENPPFVVRRPGCDIPPLR